jgi:hypothetical protein
MNVVIVSAHRLVATSKYIKVCKHSMTSRARITRNMLNSLKRQGYSRGNFRYGILDTRQRWMKRELETPTFELYLLKTWLDGRR